MKYSCKIYHPETGELIAELKDVSKKYDLIDPINDIFIDNGIDLKMTEHLLISLASPAIVQNSHRKNIHKLSKVIVIEKSYYQNPPKPYVSRKKVPLFTSPIGAC
jgi:hypothetical protein